MPLSHIVAGFIMSIVDPFSTHDDAHIDSRLAIHQQHGSIIMDTEDAARAESAVIFGGRAETGRGRADRQRAWQPTFSRARRLPPRKATRSAGHRSPLSDRGTRGSVERGKGSGVARGEGGAFVAGSAPLACAHAASARTGAGPRERPAPSHRSRATARRSGPRRAVTRPSPLDLEADTGEPGAHDPVGSLPDRPVRVVPAEDRVGVEDVVDVDERKNRRPPDFEPA